jgi:hypothetical protein
MRIGEREWSRRELERRTGSARQLGGVRAVELVEGRARGVRCLEVDTGAGLRFTVVADRGLDIADCSYKGVNLVYHTSSGMAHPSFHDPAGNEWLRVFFGGLLTTCGLTYLGDPGPDQGEELGLHGRYSGLPAAQVADLSRWEGDRRVLEVAGVVEECSLFGDRLRLTRTITTALGERELRVRDRVENFGCRASPFCILYHVNAGFPLLDAGARLLATSAGVEPYDARAAAEADRLWEAADPDPASVSVDYLHRMAADADGWAHAALVNRGLCGGLGLGMRFSASSLPFLNEWKMLSEGDYVMAIEPTNTKTLNRGLLRAAGRLPFLEPGEAREMTVVLGVLEGGAEIDEFAARVARIRGS